MPAPLASGAAILSVLPAPFVLLPKVKAPRSTAFAENDPWAVPMPTCETGPGPEAPASWVCACSQGTPCHQGCQGSACAYAGTQDASVHFSAGPRLLISRPHVVLVPTKRRRSWATKPPPEGAADT